MNIKHPEPEDLNDYLQQPQAEKFSALRLHLAGCVDCRNQLEVISSLQQHYSVIKNDSIDDAEYLQIGDFFDNGNDVALQKIKNNPAALKAALHYASHSAAMSDHIKPEVQPKKKISAVKRIKTFLTDLFEYQSPVWISSAASIAFVLGVIILLPLTDKIGDVYSSKSIVQYQDNPQIHFRSQDALPGIGFFSKAEEKTLPFSDMRVKYFQPNVIQFSWPKVKNAKYYKLRLQVIAQGKKNTLDEISTELNKVEIKLNAASINHRYVWTLSGLTHNGKTFLTSGGFVIGDR